LSTLIQNKADFLKFKVILLKYRKFSLKNHATSSQDHLLQVPFSWVARLCGSAGSLKLAVFFTFGPFFVFYLATLSILKTNQKLKTTMNMPREETDKSGAENYEILQPLAENGVS